MSVGMHVCVYVCMFIQDNHRQFTTKIIHTIPYPSKRKRGKPSHAREVRLTPEPAILRYNKTAAAAVTHAGVSMRLKLHYLQFNKTLWEVCVSSYFVEFMLFWAVWLMVFFKGSFFGFFFSLRILLNVRFLVYLLDIF